LLPTYDIIATNRLIEDWGKLRGDKATTSAILDCFLEWVHIIKITGFSYSLKNLNNPEKSENIKDLEKKYDFV
jgi:DNA replication protein DnaC